MNQTLRRTLAPAGLLVGTLLLAGCGSEGGSGTDSGESEFNDADVTFAQGMIPHHEQAIEMSELAESRAQSPEVKDLAERIEAAQGPEIEQLTTWLDAWGEEAPSDSMGHGDMGHGDPDSDMSGMMTAEDMGMLEASQGARFDEMFLEMMIEHHEGAVDMAETEVAEGEHSGAVDMAEEIISTQKQEIEEMEALLAS